MHSFGALPTVQVWAGRQPRQGSQEGKGDGKEPLWANSEEEVSLASSLFRSFSPFPYMDFAAFEAQNAPFTSPLTARDLHTPVIARIFFPSLFSFLPLLLLFLPV